MNKRYIYAGILSSILFCIFYLFLKLNAFISVPLAIASFVAFVLIYKEQDVRKYDPKLMMNYSYQASRLYNIAKTLPDGDLQKRIIKITEITEKIINMLENRPNKVEQGYNFFDYYLPITIRILKQYQEGRDNELIDNDKELIKIEEHIKKIEIAFEKQHKNMYQDNVMDMEAEIRVFDKMLKMDGFVDDLRDVSVDEREE